MLASVLSFPILTLVLLAGIFDSAWTNEEIDSLMEVGKRQWDSPAFDKLVIYWNVLGFKRDQAVDRCRSKKLTYEYRQQAADEKARNVVRRGDPSELIQHQSFAQRMKNQLDDCVKDLVALTGNDPFFKSYQLMKFEYEEEDDKLEACRAAEKGKLPWEMTKKRRNKRALAAVLGQLKSAAKRQTVTSGEEMMQQIKNDLQKALASTRNAKNQCFARLNIPKTYPYQLE